MKKVIIPSEVNVSVCNLLILSKIILVKRVDLRYNGVTVVKAVTVQSEDEGVEFPNECYIQYSQPFIIRAWQRW